MKKKSKKRSGRFSKIVWSRPTDRTYVGVYFLEAFRKVIFIQKILKYIRKA